MPDFTGTKDVRGYLRILWRWKVLILVVFLIPPIIAFLLEQGKPSVYRSTALVGINQATVNGSSFGGGGSFSTTNVTAIAELVTTTPVAQMAASLMHPPAAPGEIVGEVSATADPTTDFLTISALDRSPARAAAIANAFAHAIALNRQASALVEIRSAIRAVEAQLRGVPRKDITVRPGLVQQLGQLRASLATQGSDAAILQAATPSSTPAGPHPRRAIEIGLLIGLLLGFGAAALAEGADRRLRTPDDLEAMTDLPLLATISSSAFSDKLQTAPEDEEAFHMLRTALLYFVDRTLQSIVITSPGEQDGKTTVATRLALVAARAGQKVVLVDGDLRRAQVSAKLGLRGRPGLSTVLLEGAGIDDVLVEYDGAGGLEGRLRVLPAGPAPPDPASLFTSQKVQVVLRQLEAHSDLVIIDTPAALAVSDPLPLMRSVSGVVLVARMDRSSRQTIRRLQRRISSAHGRLVGVVATGVSSMLGYEQYTPKYYSHNGGDGGFKRAGRRLRGQSEPAAESGDRGATAPN